MPDQLVECQYCGGVRVYDPTISCVGCGAPLPKPKPKRTPNPFRPNSNLQAQMLGMQNMGMQQTNPQMQGMHPYAWGGKGGW